MPADQAAGLRRRRAARPPRIIQVFSGSAESLSRLAQALHRHGRRVLLVDAQGRLFADSTARTLFDWRRQLARGQVQTLPLAFGEGWPAAGIRADEPALHTVAQRYDALIVDQGADPAEPALTPAAANAAVIEAGAAADCARRAYTLVKTLAGSPDVADVGLLGDVATCNRVLAACTRFLAPDRVAPAVYSVAHELDAFAALAVRMVAEEARCTAHNKTGNHPNHGW